MSDIIGAYADGGVVASNPSPYALTYGWCHVDATGERVADGAGLLFACRAPACADAHHFPSYPVTNQQAEFVALLLALEALPAGWTGPVYSDSLTALGRLLGTYGLRGIPLAWTLRGSAARGRLGLLTPQHLRGHPTRGDLAAGLNAAGERVSHHQVWCDQAAGALGRAAYRARPTTYWGCL